MRPVDGEQTEHDVVDDERRDLGALARHHGRFSRSRSTCWLLVAAAEAAYVLLLFVPDARSRLGAYLLVAAAAGLLALLAAPILSTSSPRFLIFSAALFRATLLLRRPDLSDDLTRYLWDARVAAAGISPWAFAPEDPAVSRVAPQLSPRVPHRRVKTIYPPVAEAVFQLGSRGGRDSRLLRVVFAAADLAVVWLLARRGAGFAAALYAFHPLPVAEVAGQGHLDSLGVALLLVSLAFLQTRRRFLSGLSLAASILTKYVSAAALVPFFRWGGWRLAVAALGTAAALWAAAARGGVSPAGGVSEYASRWEFNSVLYPAAVHWMHVSGLPGRAKEAFIAWKAEHHDPPWTQAVFPYFYDGFFARAALGILLALLLAGIGWRVPGIRTATFASLGALLLFSPTLYPWYLLWVLPFAAERREPAFLYLSFSAPLSYGLLYPMPGLPPGAILVLEYGPFFLLLAWTLWRAGARARESSRP